jgi:hypothetical protein
MAYSKQSRRRFVQKAFWVRKDLSKRLGKIVKLRRRKEKNFCERVAFGLALRDFIAREEVELGIAEQAAAGNVPAGAASGSGHR